MKTVFIQGSYDIMNAGHIRSFRWLHQLGEIELIVGLNTDDLMARHKPGQPIMPYDQRKEILEAFRDVSRVIPCSDSLALLYVQAVKADIFATLREWEDRQRDAIAWVKNKGGEVVFPPYFPDDGVTMSCSMIRAKIRNN